MYNISVILGTRPELIKMAPVITALKVCPDINVSVCSTGQHKEMLDSVFESFQLKPDVDLQLMTKNQSLGALTSRVIAALDEYLEQTHSDLILVQGDTTTAFCGALCGQLRQIPVAHVEAGLRTYDMTAPWPEEAYRQMVSRITSLHLAPTKGAQQNLISEKLDPASVVVTGNTVIDALLHMQKRVKETCPVIHGLPTDWREAWRDRRLVLITGHRRENFGTGFRSICEAIVSCAEAFPDVLFVYPVHLNPNVRGPVGEIIEPACKKNGNIFLIDPLSYEPFIALMDKATLILSDSGGIQEEAPSLGKPVLVMRNKTERPEAVEAGTARLVGEGKDSIIKNVTALLENQEAYMAMASAANPFGDGKASERIIEACLNFLSGSHPLVKDEFGSLG